MTTAAPRLGELLVQRGKLSRAEVEQALEDQLIFGARLGTNLVELGRLRLDDVGEALAAQLGVPPADATAVAGLVPEALELVSTADCERLGVIPLRVDGDGALVLAMRDPLDARIEALVAQLGRPIVRLVVPEMRFHYLLERFHGVPRPKRFLRLPDGGERQPKQRRYLGATVRPATGKIAAVKRSPAVTSEIREGRATRVLVAPVSRITSELEIPESMQVPARALPDVDAPADPIEDPASTVYLDPLPRAAAGHETYDLDEQDLELVDARPVERVVRELDVAQRGGDIARLLVAPLFVQSGLSVLFWVRGNHAVACCADGASATDRRVQQLSVGLDTPSTLQWAVKLRGVIRVDGTQDATQYQIASFLATPLPGQVCVAPVLLRGKVVNLICIHSQPRALIPDSVVQDLRALAEAAGRAYERLRGQISR